MTDAKPDLNPPTTAEELLQNETALTVNILRSWPEEKIRRFAMHLLGDGAQELSAERDRLTNLAEKNESLFKIACKQIDLLEAERDVLKAELEKTNSYLPDLKVVKEKIDSLKAERDHYQDEILRLDRANDALKAEVERLHDKDRIKTHDINILTQENRALWAKNKSLEGLKAQVQALRAVVRAGLFRIGELESGVRAMPRRCKQSACSCTACQMYAALEGGGGESEI